MEAWRSALVVFACAATGCMPALFPAPGADEVPARGDGAVMAANGVRMIARADAWQGTPPSLDRHVTPMLITVVNEGDAPIRIRYTNFQLLSDTRRSYGALPPFGSDGFAVAGVGAAFYPSERFTYAPYVSPHFAGAPVLQWDRYLSVLDRVVQLPTQDMLRKALPEGVLHSRGRVTGFVYFERVGPETTRVRLLADFPDAQTGKRITRLGIPFLVS